MEGIVIDSRHGDLVVIVYRADEVKWLGGLGKLSGTHGVGPWPIYSRPDVRP